MLSFLTRSTGLDIYIYIYMLTSHGSSIKSVLWILEISSSFSSLITVSLAHFFLSFFYKILESHCKGKICHQDTFQAQPERLHYLIFPSTLGTTISRLPNGICFFLFHLLMAIQELIERDAMILVLCLLFLNYVPMSHTV